MAAPDPQIPLPNQPLPPNAFHPDNETALYNAYGYCLENEAQVGDNRPALAYARCLGYLLLELPTKAQDVVAHEILECVIRNSDVNTLGKFYVDHLIRLFRQNKGRTPAPSDHPSRESFEMHRNFYINAVMPSPRNHSTAKAAALRRDNYRCMVTGFVDSNAYQAMTDAGQQQFGLVGVPQTLTNFCHVFPPATNWDIKPEVPGHPESQYYGSVWAIIESFGDIDILAELDGDNIHRLSNGLTLDLTVHIVFDNLQLWFEEVQGVPNTYNVRSTVALGILSVVPQPPQAQFTANAGLELPDPRYLKLHAAVCRVARMSGAAGYLDLCDREYEEQERQGVLAHDGSSARLLESRLQTMCLRA